MSAEASAPVVRSDTTSTLRARDDAAVSEERIGVIVSARPQDEVPAQASGSRARLRTHLGTAAGVAILAVLLWRMGTGVFLDGLRRIDTPTLLVALGIGAVTTVLSAWRWALVARGLRIKLPFGAAVADYYRALFLNAALPGGVLGDVHRAVRHGRSEGDLARGVKAVVLERTAGQVVLVVMGVTVLLVVDSPVRQDVRGLVPVFALAAAGALAAVVALRMNRTPSVSRRGRALRGMLAEAREGLLARRNGPGVLVSSVAVLAGHVAMFVLAARVAGSAASVLALLPLAVLALLAMGLPLNVGGWGPREGVTAWAFGAAGLGAETGLAVAVVYGVLSFVAALPGAVVLVARWYTGLRAGAEAAGPGEAGETGSGGAAVAVPDVASAGRGAAVPRAGSQTAVVLALASAGAEAAGPGEAGETGSAGAEAAVPAVGGTAGYVRPMGGSAEPGAVTSARSGASIPAPRSAVDQDACPRPVSVAPSAEVNSEKYDLKESAKLASSSFPFSAEPREGRPMTPESV